jgi:hypothetical protein
MAAPGVGVCSSIRATSGPQSENQGADGPANHRSQESGSQDHEGTSLQSLLSGCPNGVPAGATDHPARITQSVRISFQLRIGNCDWASGLDAPKLVISCAVGTGSLGRIQILMAGRLCESLLAVVPL